MHNQEDAQTSATPYAPLVQQMRDERIARCNAALTNAGAEIAELERASTAKKEYLLKLERSNFESLKREINFSTVRPHMREADTVITRKTGECVEKALESCRAQLKYFAGTSDFRPLLKEMIIETVDYARELIASENADGHLGQLCTSADLLDDCRQIAADLKLKVEVTDDSQTWGGVTMVTDDGKHRIHNTLLTRLSKRDSELRTVATMMIQKAFAQNNK